MRRALEFAGPRVSHGRVSRKLPRHRWVKGLHERRYVSDEEFRLFIVKPEMQLTEIPMSTRLFLGLKNACGKETLCECAEALSEDTLRGNGIGPVTIAEFKRLCYKAHILGA